MFKYLLGLVLVVVLAVPVMAADKKPSDLDKKKAELTAEVQQYQESRVKECREALEKLMREKKFQLEAEMRVTPRGNIPQINIVPQD